MCTLIILPCSSKKVVGGNNIAANDFFHESLSPIRDLIANHFNLHPNLDQVMPAYQRYGAGQNGNEGGRIYTNMNWDLATHLIDEGLLKVLIVSALYGLIEYNALIPSYDLKMSQSKRFWLQADFSLADALDDYLFQHPEILAKRAFLSKEYSLALQVEEKVINNNWISYDRGAQTAQGLINPLLEELAL